LLEVHTRQPCKVDQCLPGDPGRSDPTGLPAGDRGVGDPQAGFEGVDALGRLPLGDAQVWI
jgi:hypothetical protein